MSALYQIENLSFSYQLGKQNISILKQLTTEIKRGEFTCIVGPSGTGKTTLLNILGLLETPSAGKVVFSEQDISNLDESEREDIRLRKIGFVFQSFYLIPTLTVLENTVYFLAPLGLSVKAANTKGHEVLESMGLADQMHKKILELSGGQRQRVAIARALAKSPEVILADEPTANLDRETATKIIEAFQRLQKSHQTSFIFSTHDPHLVSYAETVFKMQDGKLA